jgi:4-amino-4-deoxy-L-arabinose transferase-like glycosyltransferase
MHNNQKTLSVFWLLFFLFVCAVPLFWQLDALALRLWDEARRGVNALEMASDGNWLVPHFMGAPDNWGTKPPLLIWCQVFFLQFIDSPELAIRLPSALAGLFTALLLAWAGKYLLNRPLAGCFAALVLLTSNIYLDAHGAIAGDYDALLTLWLSAQVFCFFLYLKEKRDRWLYLTGLFVLLAGWTKGVAAFFFAPGLLLYALSTADNRIVFRQPKVYLVAFLALAGILAYYFLREGLYPGYLKTVWENELGGRYLDVKEGHGWSTWFYFRLIHQYELFFPWQYFLPLGFGLMWLEKKHQPLGQLLLMTSIVFLFVISTSATKLSWYVLPVIPLLSLVVGSSLERLYQGLLTLLQKKAENQPLGRSVQILYSSFFILAMFAFPYLRMVQKVTSLEFKGEEREQQLYRDFFRQLPPEQAFTVVLPKYNGHFSFYQQVFNQEGYHITAAYLKKPPAEIQADANAISLFDQQEIVVVCETKAKVYLEEQYDMEELMRWDNCQQLRIKAVKLSQN